MKVAFLDLETSGMWPWRYFDGRAAVWREPAEILEVAVVVCEATPELPIVEAFEAKCIPEHIETASPKALEINHFDAEVWAREALPLSDVMLEARDRLHWNIPAGHNVLDFDLCWLRAYWQSFPRTEPTLRRQVFDSRAAAEPLKSAGLVKSVSLGALVELFGIERQGKAHSALSDALASREVWLRLQRMMRAGFERLERQIEDDAVSVTFVDGLMMDKGAA